MKAHSGRAGTASVKLEHELSVCVSIVLPSYGIWPMHDNAPGVKDWSQFLEDAAEVPKAIDLSESDSDSDE